MKSLRNKIVLTAEFPIPTNKDVQDTVEDEIYREIGQISPPLKWIIYKELKDETNKR
jgi:hypothetical protein